MSEVKRYNPYLDNMGCDKFFVLASDYDALLTENLEQARLLGMSAERELALLAERDALRKDADKFRHVERAMEALGCDEREGGIVTAASLILISSAHRMNAKRGVIDQEGVTFGDGQIGDWRVTIERIDHAMQGKQP